MIIVLHVLVGRSLYTDGSAVTFPLFIIDLPICILDNLWTITKGTLLENKGTFSSVSLFLQEEFPGP